MKVRLALPATALLLLASCEPSPVAVAPPEVAGAPPAAAAARAAWDERRELYRQKAESPPQTPPPDAQRAAPCPEDTIEWHRGVGVTLCATPCSSDEDCDAEARCRVVHENAAETLRLCDPYADRKGIVRAPEATP